MFSSAPRLLLVALSCIFLATVVDRAYAEQMQEFGDWEVHYMVLPTSYLQPDIAAKYSVVRGDDRALVNISLIHKDRGPSEAQVSGEYKNLLSQYTKLKFIEVKEGAAVYYLAQIKHTDRDFLRFRLAVNAAEDRVLEVAFSQTMYASP